MNKYEAREMELTVIFFCSCPFSKHFSCESFCLGSKRQSTPNGLNYSGSYRDPSSPPQNDNDYKYGRFDASALHIAHALKQTAIQKAYDKPKEKPIDVYLVSNSKVFYKHLNKTPPRFNTFFNRDQYKHILYDHSPRCISHRGQSVH